MNLLVDLGNTRLKWATCNNPEDILLGQTIVNSALTCELLTLLWQSIGRPEKIAIAHVSKNEYYDIVQTVANELWPTISITKAETQAHEFGVINAYQHPQKLGIDRWLGIIATYHKRQQAFCLVGCGTALTLDVVDNTGKHLGGLINPGLRLMREALAKQTANLDLSTETYTVGLAKHTEAAIYSGTLTAACGFIEMSLKDYEKSLPLILTGGDAHIIATLLARPATIESYLVLDGLALILNKSP